MLASNRTSISHGLADDAVVLDVGGWANPVSRADWVIDLMPYETRGLYGEPDPNPPRFSSETWVVRDICDREPWPFDDGFFDFAVCSHTLEDVRDPIWVCAELNRVAKAGYIEVPSRSEEQTYGVHGEWVGWSHHHWLIDIADGCVEFVFKSHVLHGRPEFWVSTDWTLEQPPESRVSTFFWESSFAFRERVFLAPEELHDYLGGVFAKYDAVAAKGPGHTLRGLLGRGRGLARGLRRVG